MSLALSQLLVLLRLRLKLLLRSGITRYTRSARAAAPLRLLLMFFFIAWGIGFIVVPITMALATGFGGPDHRHNLTPLLAFSFSAATVIVFFYAVLSLVGALTYRSDLKLLLLSPLSPRLIMASKILGVSLGFSAFTLPGVPALLAIGQAQQLGAIYDAAIFVAVLLVPITPTSLAVLLVLALLRWIPPARARAITTFVGVGLGGLFFIGTQLLAQSSVHPGVHSVSAPSLPVWLPSVWPGRALAAIALGRHAEAIEFSLATLGLTLLLFSTATELSARVFTTGAATYQEVARRRAISRQSVEKSAAAGSRLAVSIPWWPIIWKDWLTLRRDPQQLASLIYPLLIIGFYLYRLLGTHSFLGPAESLSFRAGSLYTVLAFAAVLLLGSLVAPAINRESRSVYLLALAPLSARDVFLAKWVFGITPSLIVVEGILIGGVAVLGVSPGQALMAGVVLAFLAMTLAGVVIAINLIWPRLTWESPRRQVSGIASLISFAVEFGIAGVSCFALITAIALWPSHPFWAVIVTSVLFLLLAGISGAVWVIGPRRLQALLSSDQLLR